MTSLTASHTKADSMPSWGKKSAQEVEHLEKQKQSISKVKLKGGHSAKQLLHFPAFPLDSIQKPVGIA